MRRMTLTAARWGLLAGLLLGGAAPALAGGVHREVPGAIDLRAAHLFYLHGRALERGGRRAAAYDYGGILEALAERGFVAIGEERGPVRIEEYAERVAGQVRQLLAAGVPAGQITVAGHSKGGMIAMAVMALLAEPEVAYVNFAGCGLAGGERESLLRFAEQGARRARGRLLSAYERGDRVAGSCAAVFERMPGATVRERVLEVGGGHELFTRPEPAWLDLLQAWAERRGE